MKTLIIAVLTILVSFGAHASGGADLEHADIDITDKASLQRGAKYFVNYCLSCHSAKHLRYSRMAKDLSIDTKLVEENLIFTDQKVLEGMTIAMTAKDGEKWFGITPPDLSLIARSRGSDWLYSYLKAFYLDDSRPFGVNNSVFPDVGMPHVLADLQGLAVPVYKDVEKGDGSLTEELDHMKIVKPGRLNAEEYDQVVLDLVNFLSYMGEPIQVERAKIGKKVILFLLLMLIIFYFLKKEYWKDIH